MEQASSIKILSLNLWAGQVFEPLMEFLVSKAETVDIFCFQEVFSTESDQTDSHGNRANLLQEISRILPAHNVYFAPVQENFDYKGTVEWPLAFGNAIFVKKSCRVISLENYFICGNKNELTNEKFAETKWKYMPRLLMCMEVVTDNKTLHVYNYHGLWDSSGKGDTPERLEQSKRIREIVNNFGYAKSVVCGDFNLEPHSESISLLENGMSNLISDFKISSTRSSFYTKEGKFADYIFVTPDIQVLQFRVLDDQVSDHLPLEVECV